MICFKLLGIAKSAPEIMFFHNITAPFFFNIASFKIKGPFLKRAIGEIIVSSMKRKQLSSHSIFYPRITEQVQ